MHADSFLQLLTKSLGLEWTANGSRLDADAVLKPLVLIAIIVLAGPDFFAVVELTTLLDLLGATMFILAYGAGAKLLGEPVLRTLKSVFIPAEYAILINMRGQPVAMAFGLLFIVAHAALFATLGLVSYVGVMHYMS
jgi:hypothetical protein